MSINSTKLDIACILVADKLSTTMLFVVVLPDDVTESRVFSTFIPSTVVLWVVPFWTFNINS